MVQPFLGELALVPYNFAPAGWALCHGQLLPINQNQALFALLGTTYGGDGKSTFALPDLRGRVPVASGQGPGRENYVLGQSGGTERVTVSTQKAAAEARAGAAAGMGSAEGVDVEPAASRDVPDSRGVAPMLRPGAGQTFDNRQPYLTMNWIIALQGAWPAKS